MASSVLSVIRVELVIFLHYLSFIRPSNRIGQSHFAHYSCLIGCIHLPLLTTCLSSLNILAMAIVGSGMSSADSSDSPNKQARSLPRTEKPPPASPVGMIRIASSKLLTRYIKGVL